jgi:hypothetical protein
MVEHTLPASEGNRRLVQDFENFTQTLDTFSILDSIQLALRRVGRELYKQQVCTPRSQTSANVWSRDRPRQRATRGRRLRTFPVSPRTEQFVKAFRAAASVHPDTPATGRRPKTLNERTIPATAIGLPEPYLIQQGAETRLGAEESQFRRGVDAHGSSSWAESPRVKPSQEVTY